MSMLFEDTDRLVSDQLRRRGVSFLPALLQRMTYLAIKFQQYVQTQKLSGQALNQRSGKLIGSVRVIPAAVVGSNVEATVEAAGGPAWYGKVHEFGGKGSYVIEAVNAKSLAFNTVNGMIFRKRVVHPPAAERSFMRTSAEELRGEISESLQEVVSKGGE